MKVEGYYCDTPIVVTEHCGVYVAKRKHKKRRIQKKWLKKFGKIFEPSPNLIIAKMYGKVILFCHPKYWNEYKKMFVEKGGYIECRKEIG